MTKAFEICQFDGVTEVDREEIPLHRLSDKQAETMMSNLAARHLTFREVILGAVSRHKGGPIRNNLLDARRSSNTHEISSGENPHYVLRAIDKSTDSGEKNAD